MSKADDSGSNGAVMVMVMVMVETETLQKDGR